MTQQSSLGGPSHAASQRPPAIEWVPALIGIVQRAQGSWPSRSGLHQRAMSAVSRLAELGSTQAIEPLLEVLLRWRWRWNDPLRPRILECLGKLGPAVVEPALAMLRNADLDAQRTLCSVLADAKVRDRRLVRAFRRLLEDDPGHAAECFSSYGDRRCRTILREFLERYECRLGDRDADEDLQRLVSAYEHLGGRMPWHLDERVRVWIGEARARRRPPSDGSSPFEGFRFARQMELEGASRSGGADPSQPGGMGPCSG